MNRNYEKVLIIGQEKGYSNGVQKWSDDLINTLDGMPLGDNEIVIMLPSKHFLKASGSDHKITSHMAETFNPDEVKDFSDQEKYDYCIQVASMRLHTYLFSFVAGGSVIFFVTNEVINQAGWSFGAQKNPYYFGKAPAHKSMTHPLLSSPWDELTPLNDIIFESEYPKTLTVCDLLFPGDKNPDPFIYAGFKRILQTEVKLSPAYENKFSQALALIAEPLTGSGAMLILPEPYDIDTAFSILVNGKPSASTKKQQAKKESRKAEFIRLATPLVKADKHNPRSMTEIIAEAIVDIDEKQSTRTYLRYLEQEFPTWYAEKSEKWSKNKGKRSDR